jgi:hypothetical protein
MPLEDIEKVMSAAVKETVNKSKISVLPGFSFNQDVKQEG